MKLLYLADIRFPMERANGIQTVSTAHALASREARVELVVRRSDSRSDEACLAFFDLAPHPNLRLRRVPTPIGRFSHLLASLGLLARRHWDVVYTRDLLLADLAIRLGRVPCVVYEAHTVAAVFAEEKASLYAEGSPPSPAKLLRIDARERRVCQRAQGLVTITKGLRDALAERHGTLPPTAIVPDGCRVPARIPSFRRHAPPRVGYIGQLYPWKGVDVLIEAMQSVPRAEAVVVGGLRGEPDLDRVKELAERLSISDRVHFTGFLPPHELSEQREKADVFVIPLLDSATARRFTSPLKLFEAMAAGRPIVASDLPSIREVLAHEENALLVPAGDPRALASAIDRLLADDSLSVRLAERAGKDVRAYSWDRRAENLLAFLERARSKELARLAPTTAD
ncbi:MAG TPA: glycosyltransferase family 4 protein [Vicinamibacteria bacterium]|nr:glycosyltransferase family 4 protein [Vicinamibacteria bacterium]